MNIPHTMSNTNIPLDLELQKRYPLREVACYDATHPILMHDLPIIGWVCDVPSERSVTYVMMWVFQQYVANSITGLMLDVGANAGYFGLLAAQHGHDVLFFDLQPECQMILHNNILVNGFATQAQVVAAGVSHVASSIMVPSDGCNGRFPVVAYEEDAFVHYNSTAQLYPLTEFLPNVPPNFDIMMLKVDTEGNEQRVLQGAMEFFSNHNIRNAIVEVTPGYDFWKHSGIEADDVIDALAQVISYGYIAIALNDWTVFRNHTMLTEYPLIRDRAGQIDVWFTMEPFIIIAVGGRTKVDPSIIAPPS